MKKIFAFILSVGLIAAIGTSSISCAPSDTPETYNNKLLATHSSLSLTATDSLQTTGVALFCGCTFQPLVVTGYGGDTTDIRFTFADFTTLINEHTLQAEINPSTLKTHDTAAAWIALEYNDSSAPFGTMLYDTIRASAIY